MEIGNPQQDRVNGTNRDQLLLQTLSPDSITLPPPARTPNDSRSVFGNQQSGAALSNRPSRLSKYGVVFQPPKDDAVHYPTDADQLSFFEKV